MDPTPELLEMLRRQSGLGLDRDGRWHIRGEPITHERTLETLHKGLDVRDDGQITVSVGDQWAYVDVEDTAFVVRNIRPIPAQTATAPDSVELILNGSRRENLDPTTLHITGDGALYCRVLGGRTRARFLRPAYHNLLPFLTEVEAPGGGYALQLTQGLYPIVAAPSAEG